MDLEDLAGVAGAGPGAQIPANFDAENAPNAEEVSAMPPPAPEPAADPNAPSLQIEQQFAVVCFEQAEAYFNLITAVRPSTLKRLTQCVQLFTFCSSAQVQETDPSSRRRMDDEIVEAFTAAFPELANDDEALKVVKEADMKSVEGKKRWREFMTPFDGKGASLGRGQAGCRGRAAGRGAVSLTRVRHSEIGRASCRERVS